MSNSLKTTEPKLSKKISHSNVLSLITHKGIAIVHLNEIINCHAHGCYLDIEMLDKSSILLCQRIKDLEAVLKDKNIIRCHDSYLINLKFVDEIIGNTRKGRKAIMINGKEVPISRRMANPFFEQYLNFKKQQKIGFNKSE